jgi:hypothetical protein
MIALKIEPVNPSPQTYVCGFGARPRLSACPAQTGLGRRAGLSFDLEANFGPSSGRGLDRWCGVKIPDDLDVDFTNFGPNSYGPKSSGASFKRDARRRVYQKD